MRNEPATKRRRASRAASVLRDPRRGRAGRPLVGRWSAWFDGLQLSHDELSQTTIVGPVTDQAALHGLLAKIRDLALPLLSVRRIAPNR